MSHYIYKFLDKNENVIYVGRTGNLRKRIDLQHFTQAGHLPDECYLETVFVVYHQCISPDDAKIRERYLILKESPHYNTQMKTGDALSFSIDDWEWKYKPVDKGKLLEARSSALTIKAEPDIFDHMRKTFSPSRDVPYKSLVPFGSLPCYSQLSVKPIESVKFKTDNDQPNPLIILPFNNRLWCFHDNIQKHLYSMSTLGSPTQTVRMINERVINYDDVCLLSDSRLISRYTTTHTYSIYERPLYPEKTVLISLSAVSDAMNYAVEREIKPYRRKLEQNGFFALRRRGEHYFSIEDMLKDVAADAKKHYGIHGMVHSKQNIETALIKTMEAYHQ